MAAQPLNVTAPPRRCIKRGLPPNEISVEGWFTVQVIEADSVVCASAHTIGLGLVLVTWQIVAKVLAPSLDIPTLSCSILQGQRASDVFAYRRLSPETSMKLPSTRNRYSLKILF